MSRKMLLGDPPKENPVTFSVTAGSVTEAAFLEFRCVNTAEAGDLRCRTPHSFHSDLFGAIHRYLTNPMVRQNGADFQIRLLDFPASALRL